MKIWPFSTFKELERQRNSFEAAWKREKILTSELSKMISPDEKPFTTPSGIYICFRKYKGWPYQHGFEGGITIEPSSEEAPSEKENK